MTKIGAGAGCGMADHIKVVTRKDAKIELDLNHMVCIESRRQVPGAGPQRGSRQTGRKRRAMDDPGPAKVMAGIRSQGSRRQGRKGRQGRPQTGEPSIERMLISNHKKRKLKGLCAT